MSTKKLNALIAAVIYTGYLALSAVSAKAEEADLPKPTSIADANLVILQYHHVSNNTPRSTSISPELFAEHMEYLAANHNVIALDKAISAIQNNETLPAKSVAITFDDGFTNILENAHPILQKHNFEYTIFINPAIIDIHPSQLSWEQVKQMQPLAHFANHTLDHAHLLTTLPNESKEDWLIRVMQDVNQAEQILLEQLGYSKKWLAYPYGEFNKVLKNELEAQGYIAFGQHSGGISYFSDFTALPRFPAAGVFAKLKSLKVKLNSLAMPVSLISPTQFEFAPNTTIDELVVEVADKDVRLNDFACYFKGEKLKFMGVENTVTVKVNHTTKPGRERINCTAPSFTQGNRYYWFSFPMFTPRSDGVYVN